MDTSLSKVKSLLALTADLVIEEFEFSQMRNLPDDILDFILSRAKGNRERTILIIHTQQFTEDGVPPLTVLGRYENVTEAQLPLKVMEDDVLGKMDNRGLFHRLLEHHQFLLEGHQEVFGEALAEMCREDDWWYYTMEVPAKLIKHLYTKILTPPDLLRDIRVVGGWEEESYHICYEDEATWKCLECTDVVWDN